LPAWVFPIFHVQKKGFTRASMLANAKLSNPSLVGWSQLAQSFQAGQLGFAGVLASVPIK
jgi:3-deoxy-D-manno-octulosonic-acid transferase